MVSKLGLKIIRQSTFKNIVKFIDNPGKQTSAARRLLAIILQIQTKHDKHDTKQRIRRGRTQLQVNLNEDDSRTPKHICYRKRH